jgi:osmotically-inducible protein OsmY
MSQSKSLVSAAVALALSVAAASAQSPAPDNSKANAASINSTDNMSTADAQRNDEADLSLTQQIRKSVMSDKELSTYAHNVKIVAVNGEVTLNGVVRNLHEKEVIAMKAEAIAGKDKVTNALTIAPPK